VSGFRNVAGVSVVGTVDGPQVEVGRQDGAITVSWDGQARATLAVRDTVKPYGRAGDWTEAAKRWCERQAIAGFPGMCRVYRASIMLMRGAWPEAEREARRPSVGHPSRERLTWAGEGPPGRACSC
jgi:hypothetical protein